MTGTESGCVGALLGGRFRVESLLGRGGMASVYQASDESLGRSVAIKIFRQDHTDSDSLLRQQEEIQLLAALNHPNLVTLHDSSVDEQGNAFLVMELVPGTDLRRRLHAGPLEPAEATQIGQNIADALAYVHSQGVIHRDVKPGNILLPDDENTGPRAKLADFGIARIIDGSRLTATGTVLGTAGYFSPEQALGEGVTTASDIYSLGLVLLESLTSERAFPGSAAESMMARVSKDPAIPQSLGAAWVSVLRAMTDRSPHSRPTAQEASAMLAATADPESAAVVDATDADSYVQTLLYPAASLASTQAMTESIAEARDSADFVTPTMRRTQLPWRKIALIVGMIVAIALIGAAVWFVLTGLLPASDTSGSTDYPPVPGQLGTHLEQLQRTVEP